MPTNKRGPKPKPKPAPKPKAQPKAKAEPARATSPLPPAQLDKSLVLKIIVAKLEGSKTADWHALSQHLSSNENKPKGGKKKAASTDLTGNQIHSMYHNVIFPALKNGRALWVDEATEDELERLDDEVEEGEGEEGEVEEGEVGEGEVGEGEVEEGEGDVEMEEGEEDGDDAEEEETNAGAPSDIVEDEVMANDESQLSDVPEEDDVDEVKTEHTDEVKTEYTDDVKADDDEGEEEYFEESQVKILHGGRNVKPAPTEDSDNDDEVEEDGVKSAMEGPGDAEIQADDAEDDAGTKCDDDSDGLSSAAGSDSGDDLNIKDEDSDYESETKKGKGKRPTRAAASKAATTAAATKTTATKPAATKAGGTKRKAANSFEGASARTNISLGSQAKRSRSKWVCDVCLDPLKPGEVKTCASCVEL